MADIKERAYAGKETALAKGWVKKKKQDKQELGRGGAESAGLLVNQ